MKELNPENIFNTTIKELKKQQREYSIIPNDIPWKTDKMSHVVYAILHKVLKSKTNTKHTIDSLSVEMATNNPPIAKSLKELEDKGYARLLEPTEIWENIDWHEKIWQTKFIDNPDWDDIRELVWQFTDTPNSFGTNNGQSKSLV